jgi:transcriptional regulator with XRE-family HTH domain
MSQLELARRVGRHQTAIGPYERGEYAPTGEILERLAMALETSPEYLLFGRDPRRASLPVLGHIGPACMLIQPAEGHAAATMRLAEERLTVAHVEDDLMAPVLRKGQLALLATGLTTDPSAWLGRDALVDLTDGRRLLRRLLPAAEPGRFDLAAHSGPTLHNLSVASARPVLGVLWPEAMAPPR